MEKEKPSSQTNLTFLLSISRFSSPLPKKNWQPKKPPALLFSLPKKILPLFQNEQPYHFKEKKGLVFAQWFFLITNCLLPKVSPRTALFYWQKLPTCMIFQSAWLNKNWRVVFPFTCLNVRMKHEICWGGCHAGIWEMTQQQQWRFKGCVATSEDCIDKGARFGRRCALFSWLLVRQGMHGAWLTGV